MSLWVGITVIVTAMLVGGLIIWAVSRKSPEGSLADRIPTNVYAVTAGAMTLLMAFTLSAAFAQYTSAQAAVRQEASAILQMYRSTSFIAEPLQSTLRTDLLCYSTLVATQEWDDLGRGELTMQGPVQKTMIAMDNAISTPEGQKLAGNGLSIWETGNTNLAAAREQRFAVADWNVPPLIYFVLVLADSSKPGWGHAVLIIGPIFVAAAGLVVILFLDSPFIQTPGSVTPEPILQTVEYVRADMDSRGLDTSPTCPTDTADGSVCG